MSLPMSGIMHGRGYMDKKDRDAMRSVLWTLLKLNIVTDGDWWEISKKLREYEHGR